MIEPAGGVFRRAVPSLVGVFPDVAEERLPPEEPGSGTEARRATSEGVADTTFLPFSAAQPATTHLLMLRDMLVDPAFAYSPEHVTQSSDPAATEAVMGPYYPRAAVCPLSTLVAAGVAGCLK